MQVGPHPVGVHLQPLQQPGGEAERRAGEQAALGQQQPLGLPRPRPSRSCSAVIPSRARPALARTTRPRVSRCSASSGLRLCGMVMPAACPGVNGFADLPQLGALQLVDLIADL